MSTSFQNIQHFSMILYHDTNSITCSTHFEVNLSCRSWQGASDYIMKQRNMILNIQTLYPTTNTLCKIFSISKSFNFFLYFLLKTILFITYPFIKKRLLFMPTEKDKDLCFMLIDQSFITCEQLSKTWKLYSHNFHSSSYFPPNDPSITVFLWNF